MKTTRFFLLLAIFLFAAIFISSCSTDGDDDDTVGSSSSEDGLSSGGPSSNSGGSTNGGTFTTPFKVTDTEDGILIYGIIVANEGDKIASIKVTANDKAVSLEPDPAIVLPGEGVDLKDVAITGVCALNLGDGDITFKITATFESNAKLEDTYTTAIDCSAASDLDQFQIVLSYSGKSYADLDLGRTYGQSELNVAAVKNAIDLIAFHKSDAQGKIYSPFELDDIFGNDNYVDFLPINEYASDIKNANSYAEFESYAEDLDFEISYSDDEDWVYEIDIANNVAFIVYSNDEEIYAVAITAQNIAGKTVTLKVIPLYQYGF